MSNRKIDPLSRPTRFQGRIRHYHKSSRVTDHSNWDEWVGDKIKSPMREKMDKVLLTLGTMAVGVALLGGVIFVIFMVMKKVLPMIAR